MKRVVLILMVVWGLCGCDSRISEQDIAGLAVKSIGALVEKRDRGDAFKLGNVIGQECLKLGMKREQIAEYSGLAVFGYTYSGADSVDIEVRPFDGYIEGQEVSLVSIGVFKYGSGVPERFKNAIWQKFRENGWSRYAFPRGVNVYDEDKRNGYAIVMTLSF